MKKDLMFVFLYCWQLSYVFYCLFFTEKQPTLAVVTGVGAGTVTLPLIKASFAQQPMTVVHTVPAGVLTQQQVTGSQQSLLLQNKSLESQQQQQQQQLQQQQKQVQLQQEQLIQQLILRQQKQLGLFKQEPVTTMKQEMPPPTTVISQAMPPPQPVSDGAVKRDRNEMPQVTVIASTPAVEVRPLHDLQPSIQVMARCFIFKNRSIEASH